MVDVEEWHRLDLLTASPTKIFGSFIRAVVTNPPRLPLTLFHLVTLGQEMWTASTVVKSLARRLSTSSASPAQITCTLCSELQPN